MKFINCLVSLVENVQHSIIKLKEVKSYQLFHMGNVVDRLLHTFESQSFSFSFEDQNWWQIIKTNNRMGS